MYRARLKRLLDLVLGGLVLLAVWPLMLVIAIGIRFTLGAPVLFRQIRPGRRGVPFSCLKFRTMSDARGSDGRPLADAERLTPFGRFLRSTSLDELPGLWNVLKGDMSLVGPRPLLVEYLDRYTEEQARRHEVRPGVTGLAQVSGRNELSWDERFGLDVWYVDHYSFWLDLKILARTVWKVIVRHGISQPGHATRQEFLGSGNR